MSEVVLDASAVIALLNEEAGSEEIARFRGKAAISTVNLSEVVAKLAEWGISNEEIEQILFSLDLEIVPFTENQAIEAGFLRRETKEIGLSLGDRSCLALGISLNKPILTTDRLWNRLDLGVEIRVAR